MSELYWIITLNNIGTLSTVVMLFFAAISAVAYIAAIIFWSNAGGIENDKDADWRGFLKAKGLGRKCLVVGIVAAIFAVFIPSKKDMYMIVGVGTAIDYIQKSETARQLPNKCIEALNNWVESLNEK